MREGQPQRRHIVVIANQQYVADKHRVVPSLALEYGESRDLQRSSPVHPAGPCPTATRRMPWPPIASPAAIRMLPSSARPGCTMLTLVCVTCSQSRVPSAGATLIVRDPLSSTICAAPSIVTRCGELYPAPPVGPNQRGWPEATS